MINQWTCRSTKKLREIFMYNEILINYLIYYKRSKIIIL